MEKKSCKICRASQISISVNISSDMYDVLNVSVVVVDNFYLSLKKSKIKHYCCMEHSSHYLCCFPELIAV